MPPAMLLRKISRKSSALKPACSPGPMTGPAFPRLILLFQASAASRQISCQRSLNPLNGGERSGVLTLRGSFLRKPGRCLSNLWGSAPAAAGLQPRKFFVITSPAIKPLLPDAAWGQTQPRDCSHFVAIAASRWDFFWKPPRCSEWMPVRRRASDRNGWTASLPFPELHGPALSHVPLGTAARMTSPQRKPGCVLSRLMWWFTAEPDRSP